MMRSFAIQSAGSPATDVLQVLRITHAPLSRLGLRGGARLGWEETLLPPEPQQMGRPRSGFGPSAHTRSWQGLDVARDERLIHIGDGMSVLGEPLPKLLASTQRPPDTVRSISVLVQGGGEGIQVGPQRSAPQAGDHRGVRKASSQS